MGYLKLSLMTPRPIKFHGNLHSKIHINPILNTPYGELEIEPYDDALLSRVTNLKSSLMVTSIVNLIMAQNQD